MISIYDDILDSRDIRDRISEIEDEIIEKEDEIKLHIEDVDHIPGKNQLDIDIILGDIDDLKEELSQWNEFKDEGTSEWEYGLAFISENYWVNYVEELCKDIGGISENVPECIAIDWDATASNLAVDYSIVTVNGQDFYYRH